jgi:HTH-type transcriptional regulator/antitoxin HigA
MSENASFRPDWVSPPGETVADILAQRNLSPSDFGRLIGTASAYTKQLLSGQAQINSDTAKRLAEVLGASPEFWLAREQQYRADLARLTAQLDATQSAHWIKRFPITEMVQLGWLRKGATELEQAEACLQFFGVPTPKRWEAEYDDVLRTAAFRTSPTFKSDDAAVVAWIRRGELVASGFECAKWDPEGFRRELSPIRALTREKGPDRFLPKLRQQCATFGVAVVVVRAPTGCRASGAARVLARGRRLLLLSFRYLSDDHFWFTFFHEAGHLLLHGDRPLILDGDDFVPDAAEQDANRFAADILISPKLRGALAKLPARYKPVLRFAHDIGISPGIVVGQMQHFGLIGRHQLNRAKRQYTWDS